MKWYNETKKGYKYDKRIFWIIMLFTLSSVFYIFSRGNFNTTPNIYYECRQSMCQNPFYMSKCSSQLRILFFIPLYKTEDCGSLPEYQWLKEKTLTAGKYGTPEPDYFLYKYIRWIIVLMFVLAFVLNHYIHNKGKQFDIEIPITKKLVLNIDWLKQRYK